MKKFVLVLAFVMFLSISVAHAQAQNQCQVCVEKITIGQILESKHECQKIVVSDAFSLEKALNSVVRVFLFDENSKKLSFECKFGSMNRQFSYRGELEKK